MTSSHVSSHGVPASRPQQQPRVPAPTPRPASQPRVSHTHPTEDTVLTHREVYRQIVYEKALVQPPIQVTWQAIRPYSQNVTGQLFDFYDTDQQCG